jgi:hypothetical protein
MAPNKTKRLATMFSVIFINSRAQTWEQRPAGPLRLTVVHITGRQLPVRYSACLRHLHSGQVVGDIGISRC